MMFAFSSKSGRFILGLYQFGYKPLLVCPEVIWIQGLEEVVLFKYSLKYKAKLKYSVFLTDYC